ncbi:putative c6 transcription protein [Gigaspora margarita]|uniref:Putative c6 transcription protein n=1 Tax=Gigaspora margarita TaxID=4874 RepID=A0A8H4AVW1_GIGMA|nr:putative c6 transcription protein [Gigaspora margarita]
MYAKQNKITIVPCNNCRQGKTRCTRGITCERCKKLNLECTYPLQRKFKFIQRSRARYITRPRKLHSLARDIHNSNRMDNKDATLIGFTDDAPLSLKNSSEASIYNQETANMGENINY